MVSFRVWRLVEGGGQWALCKLGLPLLQYYWWVGMVIDKNSESNLGMRSGSGIWKRRDDGIDGLMSPRVL